jgi:hypothetical protein
LHPEPLKFDPDPAAGAALLHRLSTSAPPKPAAFRIRMQNHRYVATDLPLAAV